MRGWYKSWKGNEDHGRWRSCGDSSSEGHRGHRHHHERFDRDADGRKGEGKDEGKDAAQKEHASTEPAGLRDEPPAQEQLSPAQLPAAQPSPEPAQELGWNDAAWAEAGGFEAVLFGQLPAGALPFAAGAPTIIVFQIGQLEINYTNLVQNTLIQNTMIVFNATDGGSVDIAGDVTALTSQQAVTDQAAGSFDPFSAG